MRQEFNEPGSGPVPSLPPAPRRASDSSFTRADFRRLTKTAREHNMRIKAVHPHSYAEEEESDIEEASDDEFEDDDDAARAAYRRTRAMSLSLEGGLPDEPRLPLLASRQRHYGSSSRSSPPLRHPVLSLADQLAISPDTVAMQSPATVAQAPVVPPQLPIPSADPPWAASLAGRDPQRTFDAARKVSPPSLPSLDFNSLPIRAQFVCLNELISVNSGDDTAIIFTSLPSPDPGTSDSYERSSRYLEHLDTFFAGLPPVLAINGRQMSVT